MRPLISPEDALDLHIDSATSGFDIMFADVRWYLDGRDGRAAFEADHIEGAVFVSLDKDLADHGQSPIEGRHPLPAPESFAAAMGALGIGDSTTVVAYDDSGGGTAGRLVVMLRAIGHNAALLDGGLTAWSGPRARGSVIARPAATFTATPWPADRFASVEDMRSQTAQMIDARAADRYRGETEPIDRAAGHIPGARNVPWAGNLDPVTGRFRSVAEIRERFNIDGSQAAPGPDLICYCGSGVSACANVLALEHAGVDGVRLFVASWSGWSADSVNPIAVGEERGA